MSGHLKFAYDVYELHCAKTDCSEPDHAEPNHCLLHQIIKWNLRSSEILCSGER